MAAIEARRCMYVDNVPVMFDLSDVEPYRTWYAPLGERKRFGMWLGEYPLSGVLLDESFRLYREVVWPLIPMADRRPLDEAQRIYERTKWEQAKAQLESQP